jgi:iron-sulfur cluster assembly accessory protein
MGLNATIARKHPPSLAFGIPLAFTLSKLDGAFGEPRKSLEETMIQLTDQAVQAVKSFIAAEGKPGAGLRIAVVGGGCSGFQYDLTLADKATENDETYNFGDLPVYVDKMSLVTMKGTVMDYVSDLRGSGFVFQNPNAISTCGCGHSFGSACEQ